MNEHGTNGRVVGRIEPAGVPDPQGTPARWEAVVARIAEAAAPELARRRRAAGGPLVRWSRPIVAAAASVAAVAAGVLLSFGMGAGGVEAQAPELRDVVVPLEMVGWLDDGQAPSLSDLLDEPIATEGTP